jgi:hypothetical protein
MIIAIVFWLWFGIGSAYVERAGPVNWLIHILVPGGIFILSTLVAWRWPGIGGTLLVLEGIAALGFIVRAFLQGKVHRLDPDAHVPDPGSPSAGGGNSIPDPLQEIEIAPPLGR